MILFGVIIILKYDIWVNEEERGFCDIYLGGNNNCLYIFKVGFFFIIICSVDVVKVIV